MFKFYNIGTEASSITAIYFDDVLPPIFGELDVYQQSTGVFFTEDSSANKVTPKNLPGGKDYSFSSVFSADSDAPTQPNGVNPGEWVTISLTLLQGKTYENLIASMNEGGFRIGLHVQGFASGGSESFINNKTPVPEPTTTMLFALGVVGFAGIARRRVTNK